MIIDNDLGLGELFDYERYMGGMDQTVESYEGEGQYVQIDPWYYRGEGSSPYNQCIPFQIGYMGTVPVKKCPAGYVPSGQSACGRWIRQADGSYIQDTRYYAQDQACANQRVYECDGCRPVGGLAPSPYAQAYQICEYKSGVKPPEEVQKEYLITQALKYGLLAGQNCRNLSICDGAGRPASYLRSCKFIIPQTGQQISFDASAAYAAQYFNVPTQLLPVVQTAIF
jgi:hypothetical protein